MDTDNPPPNLATVTFANGECHLAAVLREVPGGFFRCLTTKGETLTVHKTQIKMPNIPKRFQKETFDRYAAVLGRAVAAYPLAIEVRPGGSLESFACRVRDARNAALQYGYTHPSLDPALFKLHANNLKVSIDFDCVVIGSQSALNQRGKPADDIRVLSNAPQTEIECSREPQVLESVCVLFHHRALSPAPRIFVRDLTTEEQTTLESKYDVAFSPDPTDKGKFFLV